MFAFLSEATRTYLETKLAKATVERFVSVGQTFDQTGWPHGLLAFDKLTPDLVRAMYDRGRAFAGAHLAGPQFSLPPRDEIEPRMAELIRAAHFVLGQPDPSRLNLRATLFVPSGLDLVLRYRANMDSDADTDRDLRLEFGQGLVGFCFVRRRPVVCNLRRMNEDIRAGQNDTDKLFGLTPDLLARVRRDRSWLFSAPVFDPETAESEPFGGDPDLGRDGVHYADLDSPLDGAVFGVLSLDGGFGYDEVGLSPDVAEQVNDPRLLALRDIMVAAAWEVGKIFNAYFAAVPPEFSEGEQS